MMEFLYAVWFGCSHRKTTFPMTVSGRSPQNGQVSRRTYVTCLNCGEELAYNWNKMKIEGRLKRDSPIIKPVAAIASAARSGMYSTLLPAEKGNAAETGNGWIV
jgi:hypothetical protein